MQNQNENKKLEIKKDDRGSLIEIFKIPGVGQIFYSTSKPGVIRGNHYHTHKKESFCVIEGRARISLRDRNSGEIAEHIVSGDSPEIVEMTVGWTHNIENIGDKEMKLIVWANEVFDPENPDTFAEKV
jgi:UDP-2-acetamido-2,6-beta-L-arabino-hexul-4-ose reductase